MLRLVLPLLALLVLLAGCASQQSIQIPARDLALSSRVFTPEGNGRHPAIVLLHGCGGMNDSRGFLAPRHRDWAERFAAWGFVAVTVDSFTPRGVRAICELKERPAHPWRERTADAYAALDYLVARPDVDPKQVFVLGWSHGGSTVTGVVRPDAPGRRAGGPEFRAAVAFYPGCERPLAQKRYEPTMPMLILHGEADDWTPAKPCADLMERTKGLPFPVRTIIYPGAHHGFDTPEVGIRFLPNVYNPGMAGERGAHVGQHPAAREKAIEEVRRFVAGISAASLPPPAR